MMKNLFISICLAAFLFQSCSHVKESGHSLGVPSELMILNGATDIRTNITPDIQIITYKMNVAYPATDVIISLANGFASHNYCPLKNNWYSRDEDSNFVRGWVQHVGSKNMEEKCHFVSEWWSQWVNTSGEIVDCHLVYVSSSKIETNTDNVDVLLTKMTTNGAKFFEKYITSTVNPRQKEVLLLPCDAQPNTTLEPNPFIHMEFDSCID